MKCNAVASIHYDCLCEIRNLDTTARRLPMFLEKKDFYFYFKRRQLLSFVYMFCRGE